MRRGQVLARLVRPAAEHTRFAVVADPHLATRLRGGAEQYEHTVDNFAAALADAEARDVDAVLSPGDLTKDGEPHNYAAVDAALDALDVPFYAVPGNHDVPKRGDGHDAPPASRFAERYGPGELPFRVEVGGVDVLGLNSAGNRSRLSRTHDGRVDGAQRVWLADQLDSADAPVVLVHHNLPPVTEQLARHREALQPGMPMPPTLREPEPFVDVLAGGGAPLVLTGHYHLPATGSTRGVREVAAPATCSFPQAYLLCDVTPEGTTVRLVPVASEARLEAAHVARSRDSATGRGLTAVAAAQLAALPLVDERE